MIFWVGDRSILFLLLNLIIFLCKFDKTTFNKTKQLHVYPFDYFYIVNYVIWKTFILLWACLVLNILIAQLLCVFNNMSFSNLIHAKAMYGSMIFLFVQVYSYYILPTTYTIELVSRDRPRATEVKWIVGFGQELSLVGNGLWQVWLYIIFHTVFLYSNKNRFYINGH